MGYTYFYKDTETEIEKSHTTPELLCRLGVTDDIELRVRWNYAWTTIDRGGARDGEPGGRRGSALGLETRDDCAGRIHTRKRRRIVPPPRRRAPMRGRPIASSSACHYIYGWEFAESWSLAGSSGFATQALGDFGCCPKSRPAIGTWSGLSRSPWVAN